MSSELALKRCVNAANRKVRSARERLFPPTWVEALRAIRAAHSDHIDFAPAPGDLLHELMIPTPNAMHGDDDMEEDFRTWFYYRHEFGKLLCLYDAMSRVAVALNLCEPSESDFAAWFDTAPRVLDAESDRDMALICLDVAAKEDSGGA